MAFDDGRGFTVHLLDDLMMATRPCCGIDRTTSFTALQTLSTMLAFRHLRMPLSRRLLSVVACVSLMCCGGTDSGPTDASEVIVDGDLRVDVRRLVEPAEIAPLDDVFDRGLYRPLSMSASASGLICIADEADNRVLVFTEDFEVVADFGREGSGPGEFRNLIGCSVGENDHVFALEVDRLSQFELSGELVDTFRFGGGFGGVVPAFSTVFGNGEVLTVSADFGAFTIRSAVSSTSTTLDLPAPPVSCGEEDDSDPLLRMFMPTVLSAAAFNGRHLVLSRFSPCGEGRNVDYSLVARIDLETEDIDLHPLVVYDEFRPWRPRPEIFRGMGGDKWVLRRPATDGTRDYFLHDYRRLVAGLYLTPLDVWEAHRKEPLRLYVAVPQEAYGSTALNLMTSTLSGDLLIIDDANETLLRLAAADLTAALARY